MSSLTAISLVIGVGLLVDFASQALLRRHRRRESSQSRALPYRAVPEPTIFFKQRESYLAHGILSRPRKQRTADPTWLIPDIPEPFGVQHGLRKTTGPDPTNANYVIIALGGSTTVCAEVNYTRTWPSILQSLLNGEAAPRTAVVNLGSDGFSLPVLVDRALLSDRLVSLPQERMYLFFIGFNEFARCHADRWEIRKWIPPAVSLLLQPLIRIRHRSLLAACVLRIMSRRQLVFRPDRYLSIQAALRRLQDRSVLPGDVVLILQPTALDLLRPQSVYSRHEAAIHVARISRDLADNYQSSLESFYQRLLEEFQSRLYLVDGRTFFERSSEVPYFFDVVHTGSTGNLLIARGILEALGRSRFGF